MLEEYKKHAEERSSQGIPALPLNAEQVAELVELLKSPPAGEEKFILELITNRTPAGVDPAAYVKAAFLTDVAKGLINPLIISSNFSIVLSQEVSSIVTFLPSRI